jgi:anthranilate synthase component 2
MNRILVIDNYDSFTYNLVYYLREIGNYDELRIARNDQFDLSLADGFNKILLSPGPGIPDEAGHMKALIEKYRFEKTILGVCLGHQGIGEVFGAKIYNMPEVLHGVQTETNVVASHYFFEGIPSKFQSARYHSWAIERKSIPEELKVIAVDEHDEVMAIAHQTFDIIGVQFHPESVITDYGFEMIKNWVNHKDE